MVLNDLKKIHELDAQDSLGLAINQYQALSHEFEIGEIGHGWENVVVAGMGGSALAGLLATVYPGLKVPYEICRGYTIPKYVGPKTLFIASSYSGNTEETLSALDEAESKGAKIVILASGGKEIQRAYKAHYVYAKLPIKFQPRYAVLFSFKALIQVFCAAGLADEDKVSADLQSSANFLHKSVEWWKPEVPVEHNYPKQVALELAGKSVVVYGGPLMWPAVYKWKISINENAKQVAWAGAYPEFNHNEFIGWSGQPHDKPYSIVNLRSSFEHSQVQKRFEISDRLLSGRRPAPINIQAEGQTLLEQLLWQVAFGDFCSIYLALINNTNPTPVDLIEKLKSEL